MSERLGLRLVLAHAAGGFDPIAANGEEVESVSTKADREGGERLLARLAADYGIVDRAERRVGTGDAATVIGQIAAEEAADLIVVGSRAKPFACTISLDDGHSRTFEKVLELRIANGPFKGGLLAAEEASVESRLAEQLRSETPVPVLIAPPADRRAGRMAA